ncbi:uncharacterized protein SCHCODRAFT_02508763 [Schizophyllum commune H4-8]|uniref:Expressed protein n=1 Tax=Schizophyllum commune (strain H4-8 / FGSC 9210) TaxID=578458 RepID=D8Q9V8_SCHCM|nr:uncharacterized protein SCHCODRAFT_02508763 [Schizophyllum commune H4-8]KAI5890265.1 hypothetical protein SCHCODRAFT_02508763 [Schizophyllum commune H4-8]
MLTARPTVPKALRRAGVRTNSSLRATVARLSNAPGAEERPGALFHVTAPLDNMANALAVVRAIEKRYGRVLEHRIAHDSECPQLYRKHLWVTFADQSARHLLAANPRVTFEATPIEPQIGGPRLSNIAPFLRKASRDESYVDADALSSTRVIGAEGQPSQPNYTARMRESSQIGRERRRQIASSWLAFGGFARLDPAPAGTELSQLDQPAKRALFRRAAEAFNLQNPYEYPAGARPPPPAEAQATPQREFRPLDAAPTPVDGLGRPIPTPGAAGGEPAASALPEVSPDLPSPLPSPTASPEAQAFARGEPIIVDPFAAPAAPPPAEPSAPSPEASAAAHAVKLPRVKRPIVNAKRVAGIAPTHPSRRQPQAARSQSAPKKQRASVAANILSSKPVPQASAKDPLEHDDSLLAEVRETFFKKDEEKRPEGKKGSGLFGGWF